MQQSHPGLKDKDGKKPVDCVAGASSDAGEMFGAINYEKAFWMALLHRYL